MGVITDGTHYDIPKDLCYSFPIKCKGNFDYEVVKNLRIDDFSREKLTKTA